MVQSKLRIENIDINSGNDREFKIGQSALLKQYSHFSGSGTITTPRMMSFVLKIAQFIILFIFGKDNKQNIRASGKMTNFNTV